MRNRVRVQIIPEERYRITVVRPSDVRVAADASRRILRGALTAAVAWVALTVAGAAYPVAVAGAVAVCVAAFDLLGVAIAAVGCALSVAVARPEWSMVVTVLVAAVGLASAAPAVWAVRRCGPLSLPATCALATLGLLAIGPLGILLAPIAVAALQLGSAGHGRPPAAARSLWSRSSGRLPSD